MFGSGVTTGAAGVGAAGVVVDGAGRAAGVGAGGGVDGVAGAAAGGGALGVDDGGLFEAVFELAHA